MTSSQTSPYPEGSFFHYLFRDHPDAAVVVTSGGVKSVHEFKTASGQMFIPRKASKDLQDYLDAIPELM